MASSCLGLPSRWITVPSRGGFRAFRKTAGPLVLLRSRPSRQVGGFPAWPPLAPPPPCSLLSLYVVTAGELPTCCPVTPASSFPSRAFPAGSASLLWVSLEALRRHLQFCGKAAPCLPGGVLRLRRARCRAGGCARPAPLLCFCARACWSGPWGRRALLGCSAGRVR